MTLRTTDSGTIDSDAIASRTIAMRRRVIGIGALAALTGPRAASALMAGDLPDSPQSRVDPNTEASRWSGVVCVIANGSVYSGVAISRLDVLTASHVLGGAGAADVQVVANAGPAPITRAVTRVSVFPTAAFPYDDWALLRLASPLPSGVARYPLLDGVPATGTVLTLVGYGASGNGATGPSVGTSQTVKRVGENVLDVLTDRVDSSGRTSPFFLYDFDGPTGNGPLGGPTLGNARETCSAGGDSGGGAFATINGRLVLVGLNTLLVRLTPTFPTPSVYGYGGGGILVSDPRLLSWVTANASGVTLASGVSDGDETMPLPWWASIGLGAIALGALRRNARSAGTAGSDDSRA